MYTGCGSANDGQTEGVVQLAAYSGAASQMYGLENPQDYVVFTATLQRCDGLPSDLQAVLNGREMSLQEMRYGGCPLRSYRLIVHRNEFSGPPTNGRLVFRRPVSEWPPAAEGLVVEAENLWTWRGYSPGPADVSEVRGGETLEFVWSPATDEWKEEEAPTSVALFSRQGKTLAAAIPKVMDGHTLRLLLPEVLGDGGGILLAEGEVQTRVVRCEGFELCDVRAVVDWRWPVEFRQ